MKAAPLFSGAEVGVLFSGGGAVCRLPGLYLDEARSGLVAGGEERWAFENCFLSGVFSRRPPSGSAARCLFRGAAASWLLERYVAGY